MDHRLGAGHRAAVHKVVLYEPPLPVDGSWARDWTPAGFLECFDRYVAERKLATAMAMGMKVTQMGPPWMYRMPLWLLSLGSKAMMSSEDRKALPGEVTMSMLAQTLRYDTLLIIESEPMMARFREIGAEVLLMGGSESPDYLKRANDAMERSLPNVKRRVVLPEVGHGGSGNANRGGKPRLVAAELRRFFLSP